MLPSFNPFSTLTHMSLSERDEAARQMRHGGRGDLLSHVISRPGGALGSTRGKRMGGGGKTVTLLTLPINPLDSLISVRLTSLWLPRLLVLPSVNSDASWAFCQSSGSSPVVQDVRKLNTNILKDSLAHFFNMLGCNLPSAADWKMFSFDSSCLTFPWVTDGIESVSLSLWDKNTPSCYFPNTNLRYLLNTSFMNHDWQFWDSYLAVELSHC